MAEAQPPLQLEMERTTLFEEALKLYGAGEFEKVRHRPTPATPRWVTTHSS